MDKIQFVKQLAAGLWEQVFNQFPGLAAAIARYPGQVPCPATGEGRTKFRLLPEWRESGAAFHNDHGRCGDGIETIRLVSGQSCAQALDTILAILGETWDPKQAATFRPSAELLERQKALEAERKAERQKADRIARQIMSQVQSLDMAGSRPVREYLKSRGIRRAPRGLFGHPALWAPGGKRHPAMVAPVTTLRGELVAVHRTFLTQDGSKALGEDSRLMTPRGSTSVRGHAIRLCNPARLSDRTRQCIALTEGIETALAVRQMTGLPVWACISDNLLEAVEIPAQITDVLIFADKDVSEAGQQAGDALFARLSEAGHHAQLFLPEGDISAGKKSLDFNDVLLAGVRLPKIKFPAA